MTLHELRVHPLERLRLGSWSVLCVDASLIDPFWFGAGTVADGKHVLEQSDERLTLCGHTHMPIFITVDAGGSLVEAVEKPGQREFVLDANQRYLINPGALGTQRKGRRYGVLVCDDDETPLVWRFEALPRRGG